MAQQFWPSLPIIMEHAHYGNIKERNTWGKNGETIIESVEDYRILLILMLKTELADGHKYLLYKQVEKNE
jgi:hypothetical protein